MTTPAAVSSFSPTLNVTKERVQDLICNALEGGSNYWYSIQKFVKPSKVENPTGFRHLDYPVSEDGALEITVRDTGEGDDMAGKVFRLDQGACQRGLSIMAEKYPRHFSDFLSENDDADTGDVFLQCALFGDLIFG